MYENLLDLNDIGLENESVGELDPNELVELEREYVELTHLTGHMDMIGRMVERVGEVEEQIKDPNLSLKEQRILSNSVKRMSSLFMHSTGVEIALESASLEPALEVASTLKKWWDALMKFLRSIWDKIKSFFKRIFGIKEKVVKEGKKLQKEVATQLKSSLLLESPLKTLEELNARVVREVYGHYTPSEDMPKNKMEIAGAVRVMFENFDGYPKTLDGAIEVINTTVNGVVNLIDSEFVGELARDPKTKWIDTGLFVESGIKETQRASLGQRSTPYREPVLLLTSPPLYPSDAKSPRIYLSYYGEDLKTSKDFKFSLDLDLVIFEEKGVKTSKKVRGIEGDRIYTADSYLGVNARTIEQFVKFDFHTIESALNKLERESEDVVKELDKKIKALEADGDNPMDVGWIYRCLGGTINQPAVQFSKAHIPALALLNSYCKKYLQNNKPKA